MDKIIISIELTNANDTLLRCFLKNLKGEASVKARSYMKIVSSTFSYKLVEALTVDLAPLRETRERIYPRTSSNQVSLSPVLENSFRSKCYPVARGRWGGS